LSCDRARSATATASGVRIWGGRVSPPPAGHLLILQPFTITKRMVDLRQPRLITNRLLGVLQVGLVAVALLVVKLAIRVVVVGFTKRHDIQRRRVGGARLKDRLKAIEMLANR